KWEVGDSTPDMEKLVAISDLFGITLDELVLDKVPAENGGSSQKSEVISEIREKVLTDENKKKAKKGLKIAAVIAGAVILIDVISAVVYFTMYGFPK
ncbi:MAG: helix-turn-helix transcriptional regulator, partial [Ruminococcus sp.]|nr:helix-turn-helix transcriptional regulator [Ruminococcus sp.]